MCVYQICYEADHVVSPPSAAMATVAGGRRVAGKERKTMPDTTIIPDHKTRLLTAVTRKNRAVSLLLTA